MDGRARGGRTLRTRMVPRAEVDSAAARNSLTRIVLSIWTITCEEPRCRAVVVFGFERPDSFRQLSATDVADSRAPGPSACPTRLASSLWSTSAGGPQLEWLAVRGAISSKLQEESRLQLLIESDVWFGALLSSRPGDLRKGSEHARRGHFDHTPGERREEARTLPIMRGPSSMTSAIGSQPGGRPHGVVLGERALEDLLRGVERCHFEAILISRLKTSKLFLMLAARRQVLSARPT